MKNRKKLKKRRIILMVLFLIILFVIIGLINGVVITKYEISDKRILNEFKVILLTDIHSCKFGNEQRELLDKIESEKPDLILLSGDIIDDKLDMDLGFYTVEEIAKYAPTYYVTGNHEIWSNKFKFIKRELESYGVKSLEGNYETIEINGNKIDIMGVDDPNIGARYDEQLRNLKEIPFENITFLISHRPERIDDYNDLGADYVFSGHAHGGQFRVPLILENGLYSPGQGFFPKYTKGVHNFENFNLIVSRGLSRESTRIPRLYNPPEIVVVNFKGDNI